MGLLHTLYTGTGNLHVQQASICHACAKSAMITS